jgi:hypothetical protein
VDKPRVKNATSSPYCNAWFLGPKKNFYVGFFLVKTEKIPIAGNRKPKCRTGLKFKAKSQKSKVKNQKRKPPSTAFFDFLLLTFDLIIQGKARRLKPSSPPFFNALKTICGNSFAE